MIELHPARRQHGHHLSDSQTWWFFNNGIPNSGNFLMFIQQVTFPFSGGDWTCYIGNGATVTTVPTTVSSAVRHTFEIDYTPSSVVFKINGTTVATITSNIPSGNGLGMAFWCYSFNGGQIVTEYLYATQPSV